MAIKVSLATNILNIDNGVDILPFNAAWTRMDFSATKVYLRDASKPANSALRNPYPILFTEFEDGVGGTYTTEATISAYLTDKIG
jgi:hypothetical protein